MSKSVEKKAPAPIGKFRHTSRGFEMVEFKDNYDLPCSLQESSAVVCQNDDGSVDDPKGWLWLGIDDARPQIMKSQAARLGLGHLLVPGEEVTGWMPYPIPEEVLLSTRMYLNEQQVRGLIARLQLWLETGSIRAKGEKINP